jgi:hypothetical protein
LHLGIVIVRMLLFHGLNYDEDGGTVYVFFPDGFSNKRYSYIPSCTLICRYVYYRLDCNSSLKFIKYERAHVTLFGAWNMRHKIVHFRPFPFPFSIFFLF